MSTNAPTAQQGFPPPVVPETPTASQTNAVQRRFWWVVGVVAALAAISLIANQASIGVFSLIDCGLNGFIAGGLYLLGVWLYGKVSRRAS